MEIGCPHNTSEHEDETEVGSKDLYHPTHNRIGHNGICIVTLEEEINHAVVFRLITTAIIIITIRTDDKHASWLDKYQYCGNH